MNDEQVVQAREMRDKGMSYRKIGDGLGCCANTVRRHLDPVAKQRRAQYYMNNTEGMRQRSAQYYIDHAEERRQYSIQYRINHIEKLRQREAQYRKDHPEEIRQRRARYYINHTEKLRQRQAEYKRNHRSKNAADCAKRRALKTGALVGITVVGLAEIKEIYRRVKEDKRIRCYLCGKLIAKGHRHVDHIVPLSKGGLHRPSNLAVACDTCNEGKRDKLPEEIGRLL